MNKLSFNDILVYVVSEEIRNFTNVSEGCV